MTDINTLLDTPMSETKEPEVLPSGRYKFTITSYKTGEWNNENKTPFVAFVLKPMAVLDSEEVESDADLSDYRSVFAEFPMTDNAMIFLKRFLHSNLGLDEDATYRENFEEAIGYEVGAIIQKKFVGKNNTPKANVVKYVPLED